MDELRARAMCERIDGRFIIMPSIWCFLQAIAGMNKEKATPYGSPPIEYDQYLSFSAKLIIMLFQRYFADLSIPTPESWIPLQYVGLQKKKQVHVCLRPSVDRQIGSFPNMVPKSILDMHGTVRTTDTRGHNRVQAESYGGRPRGNNT